MHCRQTECLVHFETRLKGFSTYKRERLKCSLKRKNTDFWVPRAHGNTGPNPYLYPSGFRTFFRFPYPATLFEIFIFCPKSQLWFPVKIVDFLLKNSWKCCGFGLFSCWQLWFHEKNCQKNLGWKTRENVGVLSKLNFWTKIGGKCQNAKNSNATFWVIFKKCEVMGMRNFSSGNDLLRCHTPTVSSNLGLTKSVQILIDFRFSGLSRVSSRAAARGFSEVT